MQNMGLQANSRHGQVLIIVALAIVALVAAVGLAIDGGRLYELRRQAQNAADAAAMGGTNELADMISKCEAGTSANNLRVAEAVLEFAALNGVDESSPDGDVTAWYVDKQSVRLDWVGAGGIPAGSTGVGVSLVATDTTTFMRVVGQSHIVASGEATAMAGRVTGMGGAILPIAVPKPVVDERGKDNRFLIMGNGDVCDITGCDPETDNPPQAQVGWLQLGHVFNQAYYADPVGSYFRTFIYDMGTSGCTRPILDNMDKIGVSGWAEVGCDYPYLLFAGFGERDLGGDFIAGGTGAVTTGILEIQDRIDQGEATVVVPMFDYIYIGVCQEDETCMSTVFDGKEPPGGWMTGASKYYYHIIGFVTVKLLDTTISEKSIEVEFVSQSVGKGIITPGYGLGSGTCQPTELIGVALWE